MTNAEQMNLQTRDVPKLEPTHFQAKQVSAVLISRLDQGEIIWKMPTQWVAQHQARTAGGRREDLPCRRGACDVAGVRGQRAVQKQAHILDLLRSAADGHLRGTREQLLSIAVKQGSYGCAGMPGGPPGGAAERERKQMFKQVRVNTRSNKMMPSKTAGVGLRAGGH